jgi:hypothetical protein
MATALGHVNLKGRGREFVVMDEELKGLLDQAKSIRLSPEEIEENRIALAAANGNLTDDRITVATMKATRTIMLAEERQSA